MREPRLRSVVGTWQFWTGAAYFILVLVVVALAWQNVKVQDALRLSDRAETLRLATVRANAESQYVTCVGSIQTLKKVNGFVEGVEQLHQILLLNALANHRATDPRAPVYAVQVGSIRRLRRSADLVTGVRFPVPTAASCLRLRDKILRAPES